MTKIHVCETDGAPVRLPSAAAPVSVQGSVIVRIHLGDGSVCQQRSKVTEGTRPIATEDVVEGDRRRAARPGRMWSEGDFIQWIPIVKLLGNSPRYVGLVLRRIFAGQSWWETLD